VDLNAGVSVCLCLSLCSSGAGKIEYTQGDCTCQRIHLNVVVIVHLLLSARSSPFPLSTKPFFFHFQKEAITKCNHVLSPSYRGTRISGLACAISRHLLLLLPC
jgi:hypothetical protein